MYDRGPREEVWHRVKKSGVAEKYLRVEQRELHYLCVLKKAYEKKCGVV